ncbi:glycosyltransferase [Flavobacterium oreochromis]|uniref:glycosyltransferase n=1 Tax=Flavobacterium oreochromis TaxID=2906078 RepID=UPI00385F950A
MSTFSIQITTKNRLEELEISLQKLCFLFDNKNIEIVIYDDGSEDNTFEFVKRKYPNIKLFRNNKSKGLIYCRNFMLNRTTADYTISLDDDSNFVANDFLEIIDDFFQKSPKCGVIAARIFWGKELSKSIISTETIIRVRGFVGCGHVWNMKAWKDIPNYPDWFVFYGEEEFASYQLFNNDWEIYYLPQLFVHHRVDVRGRKKDPDYIERTRRSIRAGWYLMFLFYPLQKIPRLFIYSNWMQLKLKVFKGDVRALKGLLLAKQDLFLNVFKLFKNRKALSIKKYKDYKQLDSAKIYWEE